MTNSVIQGKEILLASEKKCCFVVVTRDESLSTMCEKVFRSYIKEKFSYLNILISSNKKTKFLNVDNKNLNALLALSSALIRVSSETRAFRGGYWKETKISEESILLSIEVDHRQNLTCNDVHSILQKILSQETLEKLKNQVPTLKDFVIELNALHGGGYVNSIQSNLSSILDDISISFARQKKEITDLVSILHFSRSIDLIYEYLIQYLKKCLDRLQEQSPLIDAEYINRKIDGALYLLFELTEKAVIPAFASTVSILIKIMIRKGMHAPLLSRAVRQSFLKGIDFFKSDPALLSIINQTDTDDAKSFNIIYCLFSLEAYNYNETTFMFFTENLLQVSEKSLMALARDLRRKVPTASTQTRRLPADFIAWVSRADGVKNLRRNTISKFLLLVYSNLFRPGLVLWLHKNYRTVGLDFKDVVELSALVGYDVPYIVSVNKKLISFGLSFTMPAPSRCSNIVDFFQLCLKNWRNLDPSKLCSASHNEQPLVSVIFTTYQPDIDLLKLSIESIMFQVYKNIEVIVIDDCSPLNSSRQIESLIGSFAQHHTHSIIYQRNSSNVGQYASRNSAIAIARGEFIAFHDDDDISHPEQLCTQITSMLKNPEIKATHANHIRISNNSRVMSDGNELGEIQGDAPISFIFRKQVFQDIGFFLPTKTRGDIEFRTRMQRHYGKAAFLEIKHPLVLMRGGMGTVSSDKEYYYRSALNALRYVIMHMPSSADNLKYSERWIPSLLQ
jgi:hypothetical protein